MIVGIFSGYYRSGTTAWQKVIKESTDALVLHEPFSPSLIPDLNRDTGEKLHFWNVFEDYFELEPHIMAKLIRAVRGYHPVVTDYKLVEILIDVLDKSKHNIIIKDNQMWLWLDRIQEDYGIPCIFLERNLEHIVLAHVEIFPNPQKLLNQAGSQDKCFYCDTIHTKLGGDKRTVMYKIAWNAKTAADRAKCVHVIYEEPKKARKAIEKEFGIKLKSAIKPIVPSVR